MKRFLMSCAKHLITLLMFAFAFWAMFTGEMEEARYFVVLGVLFGISIQLSDVLREVRALAPSPPSCCPPAR